MNAFKCKQQQVITIDGEIRLSKQPAIGGGETTAALDSLEIEMPFSAMFDAVTECRCGRNKVV